MIILVYSETQNIESVLFPLKKCALWRSLSSSLSPLSPSPYPLFPLSFPSPSLFSFPLSFPFSFPLSLPPLFPPPSSLFLSPLFLMRIDFLELTTHLLCRTFHLPASWQLSLLLYCVFSFLSAFLCCSLL